MKKILIVKLVLMAMIANAQWVELKNVGAIAYEMQMIDSNIGFIASQIGILKTNDGWKSNSWCKTNKAIYGFNAISENTLLSVGIDLSLNKLVFSETFRGCNSWNSKVASDNGAFNSINSYGDTIITPVSSTEIIISNDFGGTWDTSFVHRESRSISQIEFMNNGVRLLATFIQGKKTNQLFRSENRGKTWDSISTPAFEGGIVDMYISENKDKVWCVGKNGSVSKSDDLGKTWKRLGTPANIYLIGVQFLNDSLGFVCGGNTIYVDSGRVYRTKNGGETWEHITPKTNSLIRDINFVNDSVGYATTNSGQIFKTTNAGGPATKDSLYWSTGVLEQKLKEKFNISLFPNPSTGLLNITWEYKTPANANLLVLDGRGRVVFQQAMPNGNELEINLLKLSPGLYFVSIATPEGREVLRWVKE